MNDINSDKRARIFLRIYLALRAWVNCKQVESHIYIYGIHLELGYVCRSWRLCRKPKMILNSPADAEIVYGSFQSMYDAFYTYLSLNTLSGAEGYRNVS